VLEGFAVERDFSNYPDHFLS
jgi:hypothetical protein